MSFEYTATIPAEGEGEATEVVLKFKDWGLAPGRISRQNIGDVESQVWAFLEWGLIEPKNWPVDDSNKPGQNVFDVVPQRQINECYRLWRDASDED